MNSLFVLLWMIFMHIIDDYKLQSGVLANLKQKIFWKENAPDKKYEHDYLIALGMHSFSWSFMIMLPISCLLEFSVTLPFLIVFILNAFIHGFIDNLKANKFKINLIQDQSIHILQIVLTWLLFLIII